MKFLTNLKNVFSINLAAVFALGLFSSCATSGDHLRQAPSSLPIQVIDSTGGDISSTRAFETESKLYVAGSMRNHPGFAFGHAAHVDVQLLDQAGKILAERFDDIRPRHPRTADARRNHHSYAVSFPLAMARDAATIRVLYEPVGH